MGIMAGSPAMIDTRAQNCEALEPRLVLSGTALSSLHFNGADQFVQVADSPQLRPQSGVTLEAWVKFASVADGQVVGKPFGDNVADSFTLWYQNGKLQGSITKEADHVEFGWQPAANTWYHLAFTFDSASHSYRLNIDGIDVASRSTSSALTYDSHPVLIGSDNDNGVDVLPFNGLIDNARIWDYARPAASILADEKAVLPAHTPGLLAQYTFSEGSGTTTADSSGNGNTGFLGAGSHSPTWSPENAPTDVSNLVISYATIPQTATASKTASISVTITNQSQIAFAGSVSVAFYLSTHTETSPDDVLLKTSTLQLTLLPSKTTIVKTELLIPTTTKAEQFYLHAMLVSTATGGTPQASAVVTKPLTILRLSGVEWEPVFPSSNSLSRLSISFGSNVKRFLSAVDAAGAHPSIITTYRPLERAYLMHWSWLIVKSNINARTIPPKAGVYIDWWHGTQSASRAAAAELLPKFGIGKNKVAPSLSTLHSIGEAADISITWSGTLKIKDASNVVHIISRGPRSSLNAELTKVARTYNVLHYTNAAADENHWSSTGA